MPAPKRRRILSLAWLVIAAVLIAGLWMYLDIVYPYQREQAAIREIERLGGRVAVTPSVPEWRWLRGYLANAGVPWINRAESASIPGTGLADDGLQRLTELTGIEELRISNAEITGDRLKPLTGLPNLRMLYFSDVKIGDENLEHIRGITGLVALYFERTEISANGLRHLGSVPKLQRLVLIESHVDYDDHIKFQKMSPGCMIISINRAIVTDPGTAIEFDPRIHVPVILKSVAEKMRQNLNADQEK